MEDFRNKEFICFKVRAVLSSVMKSRDFSSAPRDLNHPFGQHVPPVSQLVAAVVRSAVAVPHCCVQVTLILLNPGSKAPEE